MCVYTELIEKDEIFPQKVYEKQQLTLNTTFSQEDFLELFKVSNTATLSTKLKDFLYRILHGALITNSRLFKWKIKPNDLRSFCQRRQRVWFIYWYDVKHVKTFGTL